MEKMNPSVSAIVPAAGRSRRMGRPKELLPVKGVPAIRWAAQTALAAGVKDVVVVLGKDNEKARRALEDLPVRVVEDPFAGSGMAASVLVGLHSLSPDCREALVLPADHPLVSPETLSRLGEARQDDPNAIAVPSHQGQRGQPALFPLDLALELFSPHGPAPERGGKGRKVKEIPVSDPGVLMDMNTREDYRRIKRAAKKLKGPWNASRSGEAGSENRDKDSAWSASKWKKVLSPLR